MRGRAQEWNRERLLRGVGVAQVRGERKKEWKMFFIVYEDNIKIIDGRTIVTVHICTVIVAIVHRCTFLHLLMWVFFWVQNM